MSMPSVPATPVPATPSLTLPVLTPQTFIIISREKILNCINNQCEILNYYYKINNLKHDDFYTSFLDHCEQAQVSLMSISTGEDDKENENAC